MRKLMSLLFVGVALTAAPVAADEAKTKITAPMIMNLLSQPIEAREAAAAYNDSLRARDPADKADPSAIGEVLDDGTVRYGRTTITVKNPCPPGTFHYEPPPLPGRRK